jgi:tetratricopeptide (TPR) repeat protein
LRAKATHAHVGDTIPTAGGEAPISIGSKAKDPTRNLHRWSSAIDSFPRVHYALVNDSCSRVYRNVGGFVVAKRGKRRSGKPAPPSSPARSATEVTVRKRPDGTWELLHPRCALEREEDVRQAEAMFAAGEHEIARDELRWLLQDCSDNVAAHELLGEVALQEEDFSLARGHFGYAYQLGMKAIRRAGSPAPFPFEHAANQSFFSASKGLVYCLLKLDKRELAVEVVEFLIQCDPRDPLNLRAMLQTII